MDGKMDRMKKDKKDKLNFQRLGKTYQVVINSPEQLKQITGLHETHWAATSVPVDLFTCDRKLLDLVDTDKNGIIRKDELCTAINWLFYMLGDSSGVTDREESLDLSIINTSHKEGQALKRSAEVILSNLECGGSSSISLSQVRARDLILSRAVSNGDGIIPPEAGENEEEVRFIRDIMECCGCVADISGAEGISGEILDRFRDEAVSYLEWFKKGEENNKSIFIMGNRTGPALKIVEKIEGKLDQFFSLCALSRIDKKVAGQSVQLYSEINDEQRSPGELEKKLQNAPLQIPVPGEVLDLGGDINAFFRPLAADFLREVLPVLGKEKKSTLSADEWKHIKALFEPYRLHLAEKKGASVEKLGLERLEHYLNSGLYEKVIALIEYDKSVTDELNDIMLVEKLILYKKWLLDLANDFACFSHFYNPQKSSLLQMGELVLDGRLFTLNVRVNNHNEHKKIAGGSNICLIYSDLYLKGIKQFEVATAVTWGSKKNIFIGKRGLFTTFDGRVMDSVIIDMIDNPVSLVEAVKQPFKRLADFINLQLEQFGSKSYEDLEKSVDQAVKKSSEDIKQFSKAPPDSAAAGTPPPPGGLTGLRDILLGGGVAIAAIGTTMSMLARTFKEVKPFHVVIAIAGLTILIAGPALLSAWLKLRKRNLASLLEACGMAININMMLTHSVGRLFTYVPRLPKNTGKGKIDLVNAYARELKGSSLFKWFKIIVPLLAGAALFAAYRTGWAEKAAEYLMSVKNILFPG